MYRITALRVRDIKRIREIAIDPPADSGLLLIAGKNAQGKSSILESLEMALGGKGTLPPDPVRHGAKDGEIRLELAGPDRALVITRKVQPTGESQLDVRDGNGKVRKPQEMLDDLIGARFLDALDYNDLAPAAQRAALLELLPNAKELAGLDEQRAEAFGRRTEVGRDLRRAEGDLERCPATGPIPEQIDTAAALVAIADAQRVLQGVAGAQSRVGDARRRWTSAKADVDRLRAELVDAEQRMADADASGRAAVEAQNAGPSTIEAEETMRRNRELVEQAQQRSADRANAIAGRDRYERATEAVKRLADERDVLTKTIEDVDARKSELLAAAALPVPGLGVSDAGVTYQGLPLEQASGAERLRVAVGVAIAASRGLGDVWIRDGAILDDDSLAVLAELAEQHGVRIWIEVIKASSEGAIVISDGKVAHVGAAVQP